MNSNFTIWHWGQYWWKFSDIHLFSTTYCDFRGSRRAVTTPLPWASERSPSSVAMLVSTQQVLATASSRESANRWIKVSTPFRLLTSLQGSSMKIVNRFLLSNLKITASMCSGLCFLKTIILNFTLFSQCICLTINSKYANIIFLNYSKNLLAVSGIPSGEVGQC